jgi:hypothetical protein
MTDFHKIERAALLGCALLEADSDEEDRAAYLDAMSRLDDVAGETVLVLMAMKLLRGSPHQVTSSEPERIKEAIGLAMHLGCSWLEKRVGTDIGRSTSVVLWPAQPQ